MAIIELSKLRDSQLQFAREGVPATGIKEDDVRETILADSKVASQHLYKLRNGYSAQGRRAVPGRPVSFTEYLGKRYGIIANKQEKDPLFALRHFMKLIGVDPSGYSLSDLAEEVGLGVLSKGALESFLTTEKLDDNRYIIREVFLEAIRLGYLNMSQNQNWIAREQNMPDKEAKIPRILKGEGTPKILGETEVMPMGGVKFDLKTVDTFKVGIGFELSDEVISRSSIDMVAEFLSAVGEDMGLAADVLALDVLVNGEQSDGSESSPVIGVDDTSDGFAWIDLKRGSSRLRQLGNNPDTFITSEDDGIAVSELPEFKGFAGETVLASLRSILGVPPILTHNIHGNVPTSQTLLLAKGRAMAKLRYKGMLTERRRNPRSQVEEIYVSDWIGFAIMRRDARLLIDKSVAYGSGHGFPSYMDIATYQNNPFRS